MSELASDGEDGCLAGSLLLAKPGMPDRNFRRCVVLLSAHSKEGALGVILNRPSGDTLSSFKSDLADGPFGDVPVFDGGPVQRDRLLLAAWVCLEGEGVFKFYFGLDPERLLELRSRHEELTVRAFRGYAGWSGGQLESEVARGDWIVRPVDTSLIGSKEGVDLWRGYIASISPEMRLLADLPDNPSLN